eukprot:818810-Pleurochrysis_carterae.AAC.1
MSGPEGLDTINTPGRTHKRFSDAGVVDAVDGETLGGDLSKALAINALLNYFGVFTIYLIVYRACTTCSTFGQHRF